MGGKMGAEGRSSTSLRGRGRKGSSTAAMFLRRCMLMSSCLVPLLLLSVAVNAQPATSAEEPPLSSLPSPSASIDPAAASSGCCSLSGVKWMAAALLSAMSGWSQWVVMNLLDPVAWVVLLDTLLLTIVALFLSLRSPAAASRRIKGSKGWFSKSLAGEQQQSGGKGSYSGSDSCFCHVLSSLNNKESSEHLINLQDPSSPSSSSSSSSSSTSSSSSSSPTPGSPCFSSPSPSRHCPHDTTTAALLSSPPRHFALPSCSICQLLLTSPCHVPGVVVQLPMFNEREVCERGIAKACQLQWPGELLIQVLDDSTEEEVSERMRAAVAEWQGRGVNVTYQHRTDRTGYKAGNLREGLKAIAALNKLPSRQHQQLQGQAGMSTKRRFEFVAILDADFEPEVDWLLQASRPLLQDSQLGLVQTRWAFSNADECMLTRFQAAELTWHFRAEQAVSSWLLGCFGFNGTAGVWRLQAIEEAGNWRDDTTVEDMDMATCAAMRGWRFLMLPGVTCASEVPASYDAYRKQQYRWTSGPASLLRQRFLSLAAAPSLNWMAKAYLVGLYIFLRRGLRHLVTLAFWLYLPCWLLLPQDNQLEQGHGASFPWGLMSVVLFHPLCMFAFAEDWRSLLDAPLYCVFVSAMSSIRVDAFLAGLFDLSSSRTWHVTQKAGSTGKLAETAGATKSHALEEGVGGGGGGNMERRRFEGTVDMRTVVAAQQQQQQKKKKKQAKGFVHETLLGALLLVAACGWLLAVGLGSSKPPHVLGAVLAVAMAVQGAFGIIMIGMGMVSRR